MTSDILKDRPKNLSVSAAIEALKEGNQRYCSDQSAHPNADRSRRAEVVSGQQPFATIITCADSRVAPELVFDQGLGDLFVIRVAGNISDDAVLGSLEYASLHLGVNLVVVMGHQGCGAVDAAVQNKDFDGPATHSHIDALIDAIRPAVHIARETGDDELLDRSVRENAKMVAAEIHTADPIMSVLNEHGVECRPAYYSLATGAVEWIG